jgi:hypothetical protein
MRDRCHLVAITSNRRQTARGSWRTSRSAKCYDHDVRWIVAAVVVGIASSALADGRLKELETGYDKELRACQFGARGITIAIERGKPMLGDLPELAPDLELLEKGQAVVGAYCDAVDSVLALIRADPKATYKSLERALDERDNQIRKLRAASKKTTDELSPVLKRVIPKVNEHVAASASKPKRSRFPSGHEIELPKLRGTWKLTSPTGGDVAEYTDKETSTVRVVFTTQACDRAMPSDVRSSSYTKREHGGIAWYSSTARPSPPKQVTYHACEAIDGGSIYAATATTMIDAAADPLLDVAQQMIAAWRSERASTKRAP